MKPMYFFKSAALCGVMLAAGGANAQMVDCNVFLQASHLEMGISPSGSFGSSTAAPSGYHANSPTGSFYAPCGTTAGNKLGFVCDPAADGWTVGSPAFFGDYFLPGSPFEGWSIQVDTAGRRDAWNTITTGFTGGLTGSNTSYSGGAINTSTWMGSVDSINIMQVTTLDTSMMYFTVQVTLTNTGHLPRNNVYYYRSVDPDNDQQQPGGSFSTVNVVEHQSTDTTVVSATAIAHSAAYVALGTTDTNAECFIYTLWSPPASVSIASMYNHTATSGSYYYSGTQTSDIAIGLAFSIPHLATVDSVADSTHRTTYTPLHPVNTASFRYFYAFTPTARDSALTYLNRISAAPSTTVTTAVNNVNAGSEVKVYPNPAKNSISVTGLNLNDQVMLFDMMGRATELVGSVNSTGVNTYPISNMPQGNYILQVKDMNGNVRSRVRVQKQ